MPGFCGYVGDTRAEGDGNIIDVMCKLLVHWGEHRAVRFKTDGLSLAVLARANMRSPLPFVDDDSGIAAFFEGEIYNLDDVLAEIRKRGIMLSGLNLAEVALRAWQMAGNNAGLLLSGAYNMFLWDKTERCLFIMNDIFGLRPLYYIKVAGKFFFASEIKAFTALPGFSPSLDKGFLYQFLSYGFPLGEHTLMEGVHLLPLATGLRVGKGTISLSPYWGPEHWPGRRAVPREEAVEEFSDLFSRAVARALHGPEKKGILLSGGMDSGLIAVSARQQEQCLPAFTFGIEGCDDSRIACGVARELGLPYTFFPLTPDFLAGSSLEVSWLLDGMYNVFHSHGVRAYEAIAARTDIVLTGMEQVALYIDSDGLARLSRPDSENSDPADLFDCISHDTSVPLFGEEKSLLEEPLRQSVREEADHAHAVIHGGGIVSPQGGLDVLRTLEWMGLRHRQRRFSLMGQLLVRNWLEVRAPFLDSDLVLFAMSLPDELRLAEKPLHVGFLRVAAPSLLGSLPRKAQRTVPAGTAAGRIADHSLRSFVKGVFLSPRTRERGIFRKDVLLDILDEDPSGRQIHRELIGRIISLELAMRLFLDGEKPESES
jgi:asparagine synthase (glutamine-hydrolysing)